MKEWECNECGANWSGDDGPEWCDYCDGDDVNPRNEVEP